MDDSIVHPSNQAGGLQLPAWKSILCIVSAVLLSILMLASGVWKLTAPLEWATRLNQALVPAALSVPATIAVGVSETFCGILMPIPRFRRWGAIIAGLLLIVFMVYFAIFYDQLLGDDCSCFPWIERTVGPGFFIGDGIMLLGAVFAGVWARPSQNLKSAGMILAAVSVFAGLSLGFAYVQPHGKMAPETIAVDGSPTNLHEGKVLLYFFDPECTHCLFAAQEMKDYAWQDVRIIAVPTERKQLAEQFLEASGLDVPLTSDSEKLREIYSFTDPPFGVALLDGATQAELRVFEGPEPKATLTELGFVQ